MDLPHRDDMPDGLIEKLQELNPGMKVVCVGDVPGELPPKLKVLVDEVKKIHDESFINGACIDCGARMKNWPPLGDDWKPDDHGKGDHSSPGGTMGRNHRSRSRGACVSLGIQAPQEVKILRPEAKRKTA